MNPRVRLDLEGAASAVAPFVRRTPLIPCPALKDLVGAPVHLKLENLQATGSFKVRGAANRMAALTGAERERGVVTCSSGNHGRAVAHVAQLMEVPALICVPDWVDPVKLAAMKASGARVDMSGATYDEADARAAEVAEQEGLVFVHPFDDPLVAAGQGTIALEILEDLPEVARVVVPLSGGGLAGGIAYGVKEARPPVHVTAVTAERASVMLESLRAGRPVTLPEEDTVASALAGGIGLENRWTFDLVRRYVDEHVVVTEEAIIGAMRFAAERLQLVVEGGGAVGLAAALEGRLADGGHAPGPVVIVVSGGNVEPARLASLLRG